MLDLYFGGEMDLGLQKDHDEIDEDNFCYYPFMQMLLQPTGNISPCCWNQAITLGTVPQQKLADIWNGETIRKLRREFLEGNPQSCRTQMQHIKCHGFSRRIYSKEVLLSELQPKGAVRLDVRLNGKCNLECIMCDVWKQPNGIYNASDFWRDGPENIFPYLKEIDVLGGEPFVQADTFKLIDQVFEVNKTCTWAFVSNGQYKFGGPIKERLDKISINWFQISLDSVVPETYSKVRIKGGLEKALRTVDDILAYQKQREVEGRPFRFILTMCVQKENWREMHSFLEFAFGKKTFPVLQFAYQPDHASLLNLPKFEREKLREYLKKLSGFFPQRVLDPVLLPIEESLLTHNQSADRDKFSRQSL